MVARRFFLGSTLGLGSYLAALRDTLFARSGDSGSGSATVPAQGADKTKSGGAPKGSQELARKRPKREVVTGHYDLIVAGGGLSGVCAAISAARNGVKTALVHERPMLGGNSSSESRLVPEFNNYLSPWAKETGIIEELYAEDRRRNHEPWIEGATNVLWDLTLYEAVKREANIDLFLNTSVRDVEMLDDAHIKAIKAVQFGTEKDVNLSADLFVDATGLGTLGYLAGADYHWGREGQKAFNEPLQPEQPDDKTMGSTMYLRSRDVNRPVAFQPPSWAVPYHTEASLGPGRYHMGIEAGYMWLEVGYPYHQIYDMEKIRTEQLRQLLGVWDHLKNWGKHGAENRALDNLCWTPYRRENRRLLGDHIMTQHDIQKAPVFEDRVAFGAWGIDTHLIGGMLSAPKDPVETDVFWEGVNPYSIPLRSLYSRNIVNLLVAGRPISCTYFAFASTRILPTGAVTGQAVGAAAGLCKKYGVKPRGLKRHIPELQQLLLKQDHWIPHLVNTDPKDLARQARVTASSEATLAFPAPNGGKSLEIPAAELFPVSGDRLERVELLLDNANSSPTRVKIGLRSANTIWDFSSEEDLATVEVELAPSQRGWIPFDLNAKVTPGRLYWIHVEAARGVTWSSFAEMDTLLINAFRRDQPWWEIWKNVKQGPTQVPAGTVAAWRRDLAVGKYFGGRRWNYVFAPGRALPRSFCLRLTPASTPYGPANIVNGVSHIEAGTNLWISDPQQPLPQWVELELPAAATFNSVYLTLDTDLGLLPEFPLHVPPECVKDYELSCASGTGWQTLAQVKDNYQRRRIHRFDPVTSNKLRLTIQATNGVPSARVYEVRIYNE